MSNHVAICTCGHTARPTGKQVGDLWRCPVCGAAVRVMLEGGTPDAAGEVDVSLFEEDGGSDVAAAPVEPVERPAEVAPTPRERWRAETCVRCGRAFRGEWDRVVRPAGVVCHVCANLYTEVDKLGTSPTKTGPALNDPLSKQVEEAYRQPGWLDLDPVPQTLNAADRRERRRHMLIYAGVSVVILLIILLWPSEDGTLGASVSPEELPTAAAWFLLAMRFVLTIVAYTAALYFVLHQSGNLPTDTLPANLFLVGVMGFILAFLDQAVLLFLRELVTVPVIGQLMWVFVWLLPLVALHLVYDLGIGPIILFIIARYVCLHVADALLGLLFQMVGGLVD